MAKPSKKMRNRLRIKRRIRARVSGTDTRPRFSVFRSNRGIYAQLIDDAQGHTLVAASSLDKELDLNGKSPTDVGEAVGQRIAEKALDAGISTVIFDRNGYRYHGRVRAVAEGARKGGLKF